MPGAGLALGHTWISEPARILGRIDLSVRPWPALWTSSGRGGESEMLPGGGAWCMSRVWPGRGRPHPGEESHFLCHPSDAEQRDAGSQSLTWTTQPHQYQLRRLFVPKWTSQLVDWIFHSSLGCWTESRKHSPPARSLSIPGLKLGPPDSSNLPACPPHHPQP